LGGSLDYPILETKKKVEQMHYSLGSYQLITALTTYLLMIKQEKYISRFKSTVYGNSEDRMVEVFGNVSIFKWLLIFSRMIFIASLLVKYLGDQLEVCNF